MKKSAMLIEQVIFSAFSFIAINIVSLLYSSDEFRVFLVVFTFVTANMLIGAACISSYFISSTTINYEDTFTNKLTVSLIMIIAIPVFIGLPIIMKYDFHYFISYITLSIGWMLSDIVRRSSILKNTIIKQLCITAISYFLILTIIVLGKVVGVSILNVMFYAGISMCAVALISIYPDLKLKFKSEELRKIIVFSSPLLIGLGAFWAYTQGIYLYLESELSSRALEKLRVSQNFASLISVVGLYYENSLSRKMSNDLNYLELNYQSEKFQVLKLSVLSAVAVVLITIVLQYYFTFSVELLQVLVFGVALILYNSTKIEVVYFRFIKSTRKIMHAHLFSILLMSIAFYIFELIGKLSFYDYLILIIIPYLAFFICIMILWKKNGNKKYIVD
ncbi:hypothetical protein [Marisediminitalea aggregata]|uniref:hypothetical protein n=1 Tax=Marisediminitalea aggregata TaxID=634436 RepID=UPI0015878E60|nr:hypothetical protein [Marisediminitalea aggregata]